MIFRIGFIKKISYFFHFFSFFVSFLNTQITKNNLYSYILGGKHVHFTHTKCFLEAYSTSFPQNATPPRDYPYILEPGKGRVKIILYATFEDWWYAQSL